MFTLLTFKFTLLFIFVCITNQGHLIRSIIAKKDFKCTVVTIYNRVTSTLTLFNGTLHTIECLKGELHSGYVSIHVCLIVFEINVHLILIAKWMH